ncbi:glucosamine-6-phosphate deaminase NagB-II [Thalassotalea sp. PS06]|uniref:glucosamine-6-phosphate deaminase NagB-II n=1 Tax=Thalassotalea sp. PS06 TaxID=2594005 RepID=UPI001161D87C|nr:SIS domain-containing protein [Thalassotalea sp. PS06]QDP01881.1 SIS domain-containing protein [Thalassotalea sp. PS06]
MMTTLMEKEARQAPKVIAEQLQVNAKVAARIGEKLNQFDPKMVMIIGRGSSDHAGVFGKYLFEIEVGIPTFAAAPSVASVYGKTLKLDKALAIVISQSGRSPDILSQAQMAKDAGAYTIALVNDESSPLAELVDDVLPLKAGPENSVAATKSYLATLSALLQLAANWGKNEELINALQTLPEGLQQAVDSDVQLTAQSLTDTRNLVVLGRGLGFAVSKEIALKLKEVCSIHAEAFSSAEFLHGPVTLVAQQLDIIDCHVNDESAQAHKEQVVEVTNRGADMIHLNQVVNDIHPRLAPLLVLQRFYLDVEKVALAKGFNPDEPQGLKKVTRTL